MTMWGTEQGSRLLFYRHDLFFLKNVLYFSGIVKTAKKSLPNHFIVKWDGRNKIHAQAVDILILNSTPNIVCIFLILRSYDAQFDFFVAYIHNIMLTCIIFLR